MRKNCEGCKTSATSFGGKQSIRQFGWREGFILKEILVVIGIILIIAAISFRLVYTVLQKAKVVSAKTQISQLALILEAVKDDTGSYPVNLRDLLEKTPPSGQEKGWSGHYVTEVPFDPWGTPYFYQIPPTTLFASPPIPRTYGAPVTFETSFIAIPGIATLRVENYGVTACHLYLNGDEVVHESEFKKSPIPQIIEKTITVLAGNNFLAWARSKPGEFLYVSISGLFPTGEYFILGSYGKNKQPEGENFDEDIVWYSNKYPNFQRGEN